MSRPIQAVVIDDSAFMRKSISFMLESADDIKVAGTARDGLEGINLVKKVMPDIVTLDIEMPGMDGLTALKKIMQECPTSVIMISSITTEGAEATLKAMEYGAVDFIPKELTSDILKIREDLIRKVKEIVYHRRIKERLKNLQKFRSSTQVSIPVEEKISIPKNNFHALAIGISTGGPMALQKLIPQLSGFIKIPIFLVQHMPPKFTKSLADRLNNMSPLEVKEAENDEIVKGGVVYIAPGGYHMIVKKSGAGFVNISITEEPEDTIHRPSVDVMLNSVVDVYGSTTLGLIMTGMGRDGFEGIKKLKSSDGFAIAQNEESCVIYGMPRAIVEGNLADAVLPLNEIAPTINGILV